MHNSKKKKKKTWCTGGKSTNPELNFGLNSEIS